jgi:hypothetical protein
MEATASAASLALSTINFWISTLSWVSSVILGILSLFTILIGLLIWKQDQMRRGAEKEMLKISKLSGQAEHSYRRILELTAETMGMMTASKGMMEERVSEAEQIYRDIKDKGRLAEGIIAVAKAHRDRLEKDYKSFSTISDYMASLSPSASQSPSPSPSAEDDIAESSSRIMNEYNPGAINEAIKILKTEKGK